MSVSEIAGSLSEPRCKPYDACHGVMREYVCMNDGTGTGPVAFYIVCNDGKWEKDVDGNPCEYLYSVLLLVL